MAEEVDRRPVTLAAPLHAPSASGPTAFYSHMQEELARILATCGGHAAAAITSSQAAFGDAAVPGHEVRAGPGMLLLELQCQLQTREGGP